MPDPDLSQEQGRSLHERIFNIFRTAPPTSAPGQSAGLDGRDAVPPYKPGETSRLLESYDRQEPVCGLRGSCDHGTFSPRLERNETQAWGIGSLNDAGNGIMDGGPHGRDPSDDGDSIQGPQNIPSMESSVSAFPMKNRKSLYVNVPDNSCHSCEMLIVNQIHLLLHPVFQLDQPISFVLPTRRPDFVHDHRFDLHSDGALLVI